MKFAAFGRMKWLYDSVLTCVENGHHPTIIGTAPAPVEAKEYLCRESHFESLAKKVGCEFLSLPSATTKSCVEAARDLGAEVVISVNWPVTFKQSHLNAFKYGIINAHCGDLPKYRGNACPNWAIINHEPEVVLTFHRMSEALDAGDWYLKIPFPLNSNTYIGDVYEFLNSNIPNGFAKVLSRIESGDAIATPQSVEASTQLRCYPREPEDAMIDWRRNAEEISRLVRASSEPFAGAYTFYGDKKLTVWRARVEPQPYAVLGIAGQVVERRRASKEVAVLTTNGILVLESVSVDDQLPTAPMSVIASTRDRLRSHPMRSHAVGLGRNV